MAHPEDNAIRRDGCACGQIRYSVKGEPIVVHGCHCRLCQRLSGSAFAVNAMIETDRVMLTSDQTPVAVHIPSALPEGKTIVRCPSCQVALWSHHALLGERIALVYVGTLDEGHAVSPDVHCFTETRHPWVVFPDGVPALEGD